MPILKFLDEHAEEYIVVVCLGVMSVLIFVQVVMRYVFNDSLHWSEELSRYLLIWMVNIGISYAVKQKCHVRLTVLDPFLSPSAKRVFDIVSSLLVLAFAGTVMYLGYLVMEFNMKMGQMSQAMEFLPVWIVYAAVPLGFCLTCFRTIQNMMTPSKPEETIIL